MAEVQRLVPELAVYTHVWDCPVPGGCSLKAPDLLYKLPDRYLQIEVDEAGHMNNPCADEDTRLEIIAADVDLPGLVIRLDPDNPRCFRYRQLSNGEKAVECIPDKFRLLMSRTADAVREFMADEPPECVERVFLDAYQ